MKYVVLIFVCTPISILLFAWAVALMFNWFMAETFGLPEINNFQAYGLACFVGLFNVSRLNRYDKEGADMFVTWFTEIFMTLFIVVFGSICHWMM